MPRKYFSFGILEAIDTANCLLDFFVSLSYVTKIRVCFHKFVPVGHIWKFDLERSKKHLILE